MRLEGLRSIRIAGVIGRNCQCVARCPLPAAFRLSCRSPTQGLVDLGLFQLYVVGWGKYAKFLEI
jgi:hypothetical protein